MRRLILFLTVAYLLSQVFDAVLRWMLNLAGAAALIYLRDYSLVIVVLLGIWLLMHERRNIARTFWVLWALALFSCVGLASGLSIPQVLFGIKVWLPFVAGFVLVETGLFSGLHKPRAWALLWGVCCAGVFINEFYRYPWTALMIQLGGNLTVTGQRGTTAMGVARLAGFSRANFDVAIQVLVLYLYLLLQFRGRFTRVALTLVSGAAIALTTTKGAAAAFLLVVLIAPLVSLVRNPGGWLRSFLLGCLMLLALLGLLFPLLVSQLPLPTLTPGSVSNWLFASFVDRATNTWPHALSLVSGWQWVTGRGIGGIGAAQDVFEPGRANPADNLFIYLYVTAGVAGAALYLFYGFCAGKLALQRPAHRTLYLALVALFTYGLSVNVVESAVAAIALGLMAGVLSTPLAARVSRPQPRAEASLARAEPL